MAYTLAEAIWLVRTGVTDDVLLGYPTANRAALAELAALRAARRRDHAHDRQHRAARPHRRGRAPPTAPPRCASASTSTPRGGRCGRRPHRRTPVAPALAGTRSARSLRAVAARPGFRLVGLMSYEAQIAGLGDAAARPPGLRDGCCASSSAAHAGPAAPAGRRGRGRPRPRRPGVRQRRRHRQPRAATAADPSVTELTAGSGLYGPTLFDAYRAWRPDAGRLLRHLGGPPPGARASSPCTAAAGSPPVRPSRPGCPARCCPAGLRLLAGRGRGRGADPAGRRRPRTGCASATGCGSATPRPASCASTWTRCTSSRGDDDRARRCRPTGASTRPPSCSRARPVGSADLRCEVVADDAAWPRPGSRSSPSAWRRKASLTERRPSPPRWQGERQRRVVGQAELGRPAAGPAAPTIPCCCPARRRAGCGRRRRRSAASGSRAWCDACRCTRRSPASTASHHWQIRRRRCGPASRCDVGLDVAQVERLHDGPLVGEELVDRADRHAGPLGQQRRRQTVVARPRRPARRTRRASDGPAPGCAPGRAPRRERAHRAASG